jgi:hypothetical protein
LRAAGVFTVRGGSEQTVREVPGEPKLTRVSGTQRFDGGIVADGSVEWVLCYSPDDSARFVGFQRIDGSIDGRSGSLILESTGDHSDGRSKGRWRVVAGSGTQAPGGITGEGTFDAQGGARVSYELDYQIG